MCRVAKITVNSVCQLADIVRQNPTLTRKHHRRTWGLDAPPISPWVYLQGKQEHTAHVCLYVWSTVDWAAGQEASVSREAGGLGGYSVVCICTCVCIGIGAGCFSCSPVSGRPGPGPPSSEAEMATPCSFLRRTHANSTKKTEKCTQTFLKQQFGI